MAYAVVVGLQRLSMQHLDAVLCRVSREHAAPQLQSSLQWPCWKCLVCICLRLISAPLAVVSVPRVMVFLILSAANMFLILVVVVFALSIW